MITSIAFIETRINNTGVDIQQNAFVTALADGGYVVTWESRIQDGSDFGIYAQRYDAGGVPVGSETRINTTTSLAQSSPSITALADGGYVVAWCGNGTGDDSGIYAQRYDAGGVPVGSETRINTTTSLAQSSPSITALADGGYVVAWCGNGTGDDSGIYAQRYDAGGVAVGAETRINTNTSLTQFSPSITALADGGYVVVWQSQEVPSIGLYDIYAQRYDAGSVAVGSETRINATAAWEQSSPAITALADGGYVVVWQSRFQDSIYGDNGIYAQRFDAGGVTVGAETLINTSIIGDQTSPSIAALADGGYVVTWQSYCQDGSGWGIYAQRFDAGGVTVGTETRINTTTINDQSNPSITALADGGYVVVWQSSYQDGAYINIDIYAQRFDANGNTVKLSGDSGANTLTWVGSMGITLEGKAGNDSLTGNAWADYLDGGAGNDTMMGGVGNDTYIVDSTGDIVTEQAGEGTDLIRSSISYSLVDTDGAGANGGNVENLTLTGAANINATGNELNNSLSGNAGANILNGGLGNDTMAGEAGNDTYVVDSTGDIVTELTNQGTDHIRSSITYSLVDTDGAGTNGSNVENLTLTGAANINATGNGLNNILTGNTGSNILDGGAGADSMTGGAGNDTYMVDNAGDIVTELAAAGTDLILSSISYSLVDTDGAGANGGNVENLTLTGAANINATGNTLNNILTGNSGNNALDGGAGVDTASYGNATGSVQIDLGFTGAQDTGMGNDTLLNIENLTGGNYDDTLIGNAGNNVLNGGKGLDMLIGGLGNDAYYVDSLGDVVIEEVGEGADTVVAQCSYRLGDNIESLTLLGTANISAFGNAGGNVLTGNAGNNILNGGAGVDTASYANATRAVIANLATRSATGFGADTLLSIENLTGSNYNDTLTGNAGNNVLNGGAGNDNLNGGDGNDALFGSLGNDTLTGGAGADSFYFNTALNVTTNLDTITDFVSGVDKIRLDDAIFTAIGTLGNFAAGDVRFYSAAGITAGHDADDRVVYNTTTGVLYYDADGNGAGAAVQVALLGTSTHPVLTAADFVVI